MYFCSCVICGASTHAFTLSNMSLKKQEEVLEVSKPILKENEKVSFYEARATSCIQSKGHVGTTGPFVGFQQFKSSEWTKVLDFINKFRCQPYCRVDATIEVVEQNETKDYRSTSYSSRYHDVFLKDDSLAL